MKKEKSRKILRINSLLKELIAKKIAVIDLSGALATVQEIDTAPDLTHSKVYLSFISSNREPQELINEIKKHSRDFEYQILKETELKTIPQLHFVLDKRPDYSTKIELILKKVEKGKK